MDKYVPRYSGPMFEHGDFVIVHGGYAKVNASTLEFVGYVQQNVHHERMMVKSIEPISAFLNHDPELKEESKFLYNGYVVSLYGGPDNMYLCQEALELIPNETTDEETTEREEALA